MTWIRHRRMCPERDPAVSPADVEADLQYPTRAQIAWTRALHAGVLVLVALAPWWYSYEFAPQDGPHAGVWPGIVSVTSLLCALAVIVPAWRAAPGPYPHTRTMRVLSRDLDRGQRRAVAAALRRGGQIPARHQAYAMAWTAQQGRTIVAVAPALSLCWLQVVRAANRGIGSGLFWLMAVTAVGATGAALHYVVVQRRRERTIERLRSRGADPR